METLGKNDHASLKRTFIFVSLRSQGAAATWDHHNLWFAPWFLPHIMLTVTSALRMVPLQLGLGARDLRGFPTV